VRTSLSWVVEAIRRLPRSTQSSSETTGKSTTASDARSTHLYHCPDCDRTYICAEMEACSRCRTAVERVPSGPELGFSRTDRS
jgi:hypothetical protein